MKHVPFWLLGCIGALSGCSGASTNADGPNAVATASSAARISGRASFGQPTSGARAYAVGSNGRTYWTSLDSQGSFVLGVPPGQSYRLLIAQSNAGGGLAVLGHVVIQTSKGPSRWLGLRSASAVELGLLVPKSGAGTLQTLDHGRTGKSDAGGSDSYENEESDREGDDDHSRAQGEDDSHEDESGGERARLCGGRKEKAGPDGGAPSSVGRTEGSSDIELSPEHDPGDRCEDDEREAHERDGEDHDDEDKPCPAADGGVVTTSDAKPEPVAPDAGVPSETTIP